MNHPNKYQFGSPVEAIFYPVLLLLVMWLFFWAEHLFRFNFYELGVLPRTLSGLKGVLFMPLIHSTDGFEHIVNNSVPIFLLLAALIYFYHDVALRVFVIGWLTSGFLVWIYARNNGAYHIGMSGMIYLLASFLFTSGAIRKYMPLQAISLFIVFVYGSLIWGVFPMQEHVSWEGHLMGMLTGVVLAFVYRKNGPQRPKYQYEIEKELGIEPPDLEAVWRENVRREEERDELFRHPHVPASHVNHPEAQPTEKKPSEPVKIIYHFRPEQQATKQQDETDR